MKKMAWLLFGLLLVTSLVLSACGNDTDDPADTTGPTDTEEEEVFISPHKTAARAALRDREEPIYGGRLQGLGYDATSFDHVISGFAEYSAPVLSRLITLDWWKGPQGTGEWPFNLSAAAPPPNIYMGDLAESWEMTSPTSIVYHLRENAMWQDKPGVMEGRGVVAEDIVYNYERMSDTPTHQLGNPLATLVLTDIDAIDDYTVEFTYSTESYWWPVQTLGSQFEMIPPDVIEEFGEMTDWRVVTGSGPFALVDYVSGSVISYDRNPNWHIKDPAGNSLPYLDGVDVLIIQDDATKETAMRSGQIDLVNGYSPFGWRLAEGLWQTNPELNWEKKAHGPVVQILLDMKTGPFGPNGDADAKKVRQAAMMAIDFEGMVSGYEEGHGQIFTSFMAPIYDFPELKMENLPASSQELWSYNPERARELLTEAGYPEGLQVKLHLPSFDGDYFSLIKNYWDAVGIETTLDLMDMGALTAMQYGQTMTDAMTSWGALAFNTGGLRAWHADPDTNEPVAPMVFNYSGAYNERLAELGTIVNETYDYDVRVAAAIEGTLIEIDEVFSIIMPNADSYNFWQPWVRGYSGEDHVTMSLPMDVHAYVWIDDEMRDEGLADLKAQMALEAAAGPVYLEYVDDTYGFTIKYLDKWSAGAQYNMYMRIGNAKSYAVPALGISPEDFSDPESATHIVGHWEYIADPPTLSDYVGNMAEYVVANDMHFVEIVSETPAVLANGTEVNIVEYTNEGEYGGNSVQWTMMVDVGGTLIQFTVDSTLADTWDVAMALPGGPEMAHEILLSLDF